MVLKSDNIGIYLRLSEEDYDVGSSANGSLKEESNSISNQRNLIIDYIKRRKEFADCTFHEYCDDGFSGTNFDRPEFQRMIADAESGKIDTIVFKDYSRFGRNFLGVGKYLEELLPEMEVRVISVNDGYDSNCVIDATEGICIPMKNLMNDYYVKDISRKVKSGIQSRQKRGEYISAHALFGYRKNPADKHQLIIDEETAPIVQLVFDYALKGLNGIQIAKKLNELQIKTPAWYSSKQKKREYVIDDKTIWTSSKVLKILRDRRYIGDMVGNVRVHTKIARPDNERVERKDWIVVEKTHEGIVDREVFWKVNEELMLLKERAGVKKGEDRRKGFCYCAHCGRRLRKTNVSGNAFYICARGMYDGESACAGVRIAEKRLMEVLSEMIKVHIQLLVDQEEMIQRQRGRRAMELQEEISAEGIEAMVEKLMKNKMRLYERYREGGMSKEEYVEGKKAVSEQIYQLEKRKAMAVNKIGEMEVRERKEQEVEKLISQYKNRTIFLYEQIHEMIENVLVYTKCEIKTEWKFKHYLGEGKND